MGRWFFPINAMFSLSVPRDRRNLLMMTMMMMMMVCRITSSATNDTDK